MSGRKLKGARSSATRVGVLALALALACSGGGDAGAPSAPNAAPYTPVLSKVSVLVLPSEFEVNKQATATVGAFDQNGDVFPGVSFTFMSANAAIASVDASGVVKGVSPGRVAITASSGGKSASQEVYVIPVAVARIDVTPAEMTVAPGQTLALSATPLDSDDRPLAGRTIAWSSSDTMVASVNAGGVVLARSPGKAKVSATTGGRAGSSIITVPGTPAPTVPSSDIIMGFAEPVPGARVADSMKVWVAARASAPIVRATSIVTADSVGMVLRPVGALGGGWMWYARHDLRLLPFGKYYVTVRVTDARGVTVADSVQFERNPRDASGGSPAPRGGNKLVAPIVVPP